MIKYYCDGCGEPFVGSYSIESGPLEDTFRFMEGIFCDTCIEKGIVLKKEFMKEYETLRQKYIGKLCGKNQGEQV